MIVPTAFWEYQESGSAEALAKLHEQIKADPYFTERAPWYPRATDLLRDERYDEVIDLIENLMPGVFFCPEAHSMLGYAYAQLNDHERSDIHRTWADLAVTAIQSSGKGTRSWPWRVLRIIDEYALLRERGMKPVSQERIEQDGRIFDTHIAADDDLHGFDFGNQCWFELV